MLPDCKSAKVLDANAIPETHGGSVSGDVAVVWSGLPYHVHNFLVIVIYNHSKNLLDTQGMARTQYVLLYRRCFTEHIAFQKSLQRTKVITFYRNWNLQNCYST